MQKNVIIAIVVVLLLAGGIFWYLQNQQKSVSKATSGNVITSIKDALSQSVSLECNYTDASGRESKTYIKNGAVRADYTAGSAEQSGSAIIKDKKMYTWSGKEGFMMDIPDVTVTPAEGSSTDSGSGAKYKFMADLERYKDSCKPGVISDSLFTPPADVKFTDYSQMMQQPTVTSGESAAEQKKMQYEQYMKQYNKPQ